MYHVVPWGELTDANKQPAYKTIEVAIQYAERMHELTKRDYTIMRLEWAGWSTKTLADRT